MIYPCKKLNCISECKLLAIIMAFQECVLENIVDFVQPVTVRHSKINNKPMGATDNGIR